MRHVSSESSTISSQRRQDCRNNVVNNHGANNLIIRGAGWNWPAWPGSLVCLPQDWGLGGQALSSVSPRIGGWGARLSRLSPPGLGVGGLFSTHSKRTSRYKCTHGARCAKGLRRFLVRPITWIDALRVDARIEPNDRSVCKIVQVRQQQSLKRRQPQSCWLGPELFRCYGALVATMISPIARDHYTQLNSGSSVKRDVSGDESAYGHLPNGG